MQNIIIKRQATLMLENYTIDDPTIIYQQPRKKLKPSLSIEIHDSYIENNANNTSAHAYLFQSNHTKTTSSYISSPNHNYNLQTDNHNHNYRPTSTSPRNKNDLASSYPINELENIHEYKIIDRQYDDYYFEEDCFNVSMQKCHRKTMEDRAVYEKILNKDAKDSFFGIYDGHTTTYVASFLKENLHKMLVRHPDYTYHKSLALAQVFHQIDEHVNKNLEKQNMAGGSTALCALFHEDILYVANVGDSQAMIIRDDKIIPLNIEHRANNEEEKSRIEKNGGWIFRKESKYYVQGRFQITRSIGDLRYKQYIICDPDIMEYHIDDKDELLIMASDGFWDLYDKDEVFKMIKDRNDYEGLSKYLIDKAKTKKNYNIDNITLIVVDIQKLTKHSGLTKQEIWFDNICKIDTK